MLGKVFQRFVEQSPVAVMVGSVLERVLNPELLDESDTPRGAGGLMSGAASKAVTRVYQYSPASKGGQNVPPPSGSSSS
jgi:hypothetical protein